MIFKLCDDKLTTSKKGVENLDEELLKLLQTDPNAGIETALRVHGGMVKAIAHRVLRDSERDAEECMADVFVALWKHAASLQKSGAPVKAWLAVSVRNAAISRLRRKTPAHNALPLDEALCTADEEWIYEQGDAQAVVQEMVTALPPTDKEIFLRKYYYLQPADEIAAALGLTAETVYARLSRGRKRMKEKLLQGGYAG